MTVPTGDRRRARERAVQALFSLEAVEAGELGQLLPRIWETMDAEPDRSSLAFAEELVRGVVGERAALDEAIQAESPGWRVDRMAKVDRNILRVGAFELLRVGTPARVAINEAVEIAKTFGAEGSPAFVNGILDKVARTAGKL